MPTIREKRVYDEATTPTPVFVAAEQGLVVARISEDKVGEFGLERRCTAQDVAVGADGTLALATDEATLVAPEADPEQFRETGFGPATAVAVVEGQGRALVAADESGEISRLPITDDGPVDAESTDWESLGTVDDLRALRGRLVAAADGIYRVTDAGLDDAGLDDARDVAARGAPLAATGAGLYELGNGWMVASKEPFETVSTDGDRGHAVAADGTVLGREKGGGEWSELALPAGDPIADFAYTDDAVVAATASGSLLADAGNGWRSRRVGVTGVQAAVAAPRPGEE
ncbi:HVO_0234 family beta-propeller protein [Halolamina salifodinae]|uniref:HVO-0234-like beta-propeller domain-containing protein n=1 Tax=Halolamina salifodinae TaxID=1202767 RepID=A0A8T4H0U3_9EURY|nr:hypothetical protein [Halolamina salifodinae]MBP1987983.1 hypothetical protein [Halolamina salifodinae]